MGKMDGDMNQIACAKELLNLPNAEGAPTPSIRLVCLRCGVSAEAFGQRGRSIRKCLALLEEKCPEPKTTEHYVSE